MYLSVLFLVFSNLRALEQCELESITRLDEYQVKETNFRDVVEKLQQYLERCKFLQEELIEVQLKYNRDIEYQVNKLKQHFEQQEKLIEDQLKNNRDLEIEVNRLKHDIQVEKMKTATNNNGRVPMEFSQ